VVGGGGVFHGVAGHHDFEYGDACDGGGSTGDTAEYEVCAGELHAEPGGIYSDQRMDGGPLWNAAGVCFGDRAVYAGVISLRNNEQPSPAGGMPCAAGRRGRDDGASGAADAGPDVREVGIDSHDEFRGDTCFDWADAGADRRRADCGLLALAIYLFCEYPDRVGWPVDGLLASARLQGGKDASAGYCGADTFWRWRGTPFLCAGDIRRTHAEHAGDFGIAGDFADVDRRVCAARQPDGLSPVEDGIVSHSDVSGSGEWELFYAAWYWGRAVSIATAVSGGVGIHADSVWAADHAAGASGDEHKVSDAKDFDATGLSRSAAFEHDYPGVIADGFWHHRNKYAGMDDRDFGVLLWSVHFAAVYEHEYAGVCGRIGRTDKWSEFDCEHDAADVHQFWGGDGWIDDGIFHSRPVGFRSRANDSWDPQGTFRAGWVHNTVDVDFSPVKTWRRSQSEPAEGGSRRIEHWKLKRLRSRKWPLENNFQGKLDLAGSAGGVIDYSKAAAQDVVGGQTKINNIEEIEKLGTKFEDA
jgi:hypothetical protein